MAVTLSPAWRTQQVQEYYFATKLRQVAQMQAASQSQEGLPVLNLAIGSPDLPPPPAAIQALQQAAQEPNAHRYQPYAGLPALRQAMAGYYTQSFGLPVNADTEILPLMGSKIGLWYVMLAWLNPGDLVLIPELAYPAYAATAQLLGARVQTYSLHAQTWQPHQLESLPWQEAKMLIANYPHMPTGAPASQPHLEQLVQHCQQHNVLLLHDNPYHAVLPQGQPLSIFNIEAARPLAIELHSLSKSHNMAGWRIGWAQGAAHLLEPVRKMQSNAESGMFKALQAGAMAALQQSPEWHQQRNQTYAQRQALAYALAAALGAKARPNQGGMFIWAQLPQGAPESKIFVDELLEQKHLFVAPGSLFGTPGHNHIRISLCAPTTTFEQALERIKA